MSRINDFVVFHEFGESPAVSDQRTSCKRVGVPNGLKLVLAHSLIVVVLGSVIWIAKIRRVRIILASGRQTTMRRTHVNHVIIAAGSWNGMTLSYLGDPFAGVF